MKIKLSILIIFILLIVGFKAMPRKSIGEIKSNNFKSVLMDLIDKKFPKMNDANRLKLLQILKNIILGRIQRAIKAEANDWKKDGKLARMLGLNDNTIFDVNHSLSFTFI